MTTGPIDRALNEIVDYRSDFALRSRSTDTSERIKIYNTYLHTLRKEMAGWDFQSFFSTAESEQTPKAKSHRIGFSATAPDSVVALTVNFDANRANSVNSNREDSHGGGKVTLRSIRVNNLWQATIGTALSLVMRIVRIAWTTGLLPLHVGYAWVQENRYHVSDQVNIDGWTTESLKRIAYEWVDLGTALAGSVIGLVNTIVPSAISTNALRDYYIDRTDDMRAWNAKFEGARKAFDVQQKALRSQEAQAGTAPVTY